MLKGLDPLLNADVLYALQSMGHGDDVVICDTNFPGRRGGAGRACSANLLRIDGVTAGRGGAQTILSVLPLDSFVDEPAAADGDSSASPGPACRWPDRGAGRNRRRRRRVLPMGSVERFAFYDLAKKAYCVIQTGERRFYGCFVFKKGVIAPPQDD